MIWPHDPKQELSDFRVNFHQDLKEQLDEMTNQRLKDISTQIEETTRHLEDLEGIMAEAEMWDIVVKDTLIQLLRNQRTLQTKLSDLEGLSRRKKN